MEIINIEELSQRNNFSNVEECIINALTYALKNNGIPESMYSLYGYGESCICLKKDGVQWEVYEGERELKSNSKKFNSLKEACNEIVDRVVEIKVQPKVLRDFNKKILKTRKISTNIGSMDSKTTIVVRPIAARKLPRKSTWNIRHVVVAYKPNDVSIIKKADNVNAKKIAAQKALSTKENAIKMKKKHEYNK